MLEGHIIAALHNIHGLAEQGLVIIADLLVLEFHPLIGGGNLQSKELEAVVKQGILRHLLEVPHILHRQLALPFPVHQIDRFEVRQHR